jgi:glycosyltransferase involved in cell wall biosynthesis
VTPAVVHIASGREWRGGQRQVWLLASELARRGIDQVVITGKGSELAQRLETARVPVCPVSWQLSLDPRVLPAVTTKLRVHRSLLHAHDAHALVLAGIAARLTGSRLVATRRVVFPLKRSGFWRRADHIIAVSNAVRDVLIAAGVPRARITVISDAVHLSPDDSGLDVRKRLNLPPEAQLALNLGALTPEKAQSTLVHAAALLVRDLPSLYWVVVGKGPMRRTLEREIAGNGLEGRFHLMGDIPDPDVVLREANVFVTSSTSEGLGSAALAAMAAGIPVVATAVGGLVDLLAEGHGLMVKPGDAQGLAQAVRRVLSDSDLRNQLRSAGRQASRNYGVAGMAERVLEVYRSVAHTLDPS